MKSWDYFISGYGLIFQKGLRRYVIIPFCINVLVYCALIWACAQEYRRLIIWFDGLLPGWLHWLGGILWVFFGLLMLIVLVYTFSVMANLVAAPFNGFLSEKAEIFITQKPVAAPFSWVQLIKVAPRTIMRQLRYVGYLLLCSVAVLILLFIPGLHLLAIVAWYCVSAWLMAVQYLDYPMDNHGVSFKAMRERMRQKRGLYFGFGGLVLIASMIPLINFIVIPAAVVGATRLWVAEEG